jgi:protein-S-isoprenylcysteine O-methyltransferase Ste14
MNIKGFDALSKHVPELQTTTGLVRALLAFAVVFVVTNVFFLAADHRFPEWMPDGEVVVMALGFLVMSRFFSQKKVYQQKYGEMAFRNAFARFNLPGLGIVFASIAHLGYISGPQVPLLWWTKILIALGWVFVVVGVVLWIRSVAAFGVDYLTMLYVYYPKESRIVNSSIYSVLRHPIYAAALYIGIGLAFVHANWYALLVALILPLFLTGWVRLVEEKELLERFQDYADYRKHVPAFWARPRDLAKFFRFLFLDHGG